MGHARFADMTAAAGQTPATSGTAISATREHREHVNALIVGWL